MRTLVCGMALSLLAATAYAAPYTYAFTGFVEHEPGGGPTRPGKYGMLVPITITVNPDAPGVTTSNGKFYGGSDYNAGDPADPIVSATFDGHTFNEGGYDSINISRVAGGQYSIAITHVVPQEGGYSLLFTTSYSTTKRYLAIPPRITTLNYYTSTFDVEVNVNPGIYESGAITTNETSVPP